MGPANLLTTERLGAQVWIAPVGTDPNDARAWTPLSAELQSTGFVIAGAHAWSTSGVQPHVDKVNEIVANLKKASEAALYYGYPGQRYVLGIDPAKTSERSKPLGLTKEHTYTDNDGDTLTVEENHEDDVAIAWVSSVSPHGFNVTAENSVPLALNALGWDKPTLEEEFFSLPTKVGGHIANNEIPKSPEDRDKQLAEAVDRLRGIALYDQLEGRKAERVAQREKHAQEAEAKRKADYEASKKESLERTKAAFEQAAVEAALGGASAESAAKVQMALSAYETARRKFEGLPH